MCACPVAAAQESTGGTPVGPPIGDPATGGTSTAFADPAEPLFITRARQMPAQVPTGVTAQLTPPVPLVEDPGTGGDGGSDETGDDEGAAAQPQSGDDAAPSTATSTSTGLASTGLEVMLLAYAGLALFLLGAVMRVAARNS